MSNGTKPLNKLAVLIDADNASHAVIEPLLAEVGRFGVATIKRIYGDWTSNRNSSWKDKLLSHGIQPVQQFHYTTGKNATDSAMIIDAMDLLYRHELQGFCLVTSDSDFTRLAARLRESGLTVYGFGEKKTPRAFVAACDKFIYTELLLQGAEDSGRTTQLSATELAKDKKLVGLFRSAIEAASDETGWATLSAVGSHIAQQSPDFDPRNYGYSKLSELANATRLFTLKNEQGKVLISSKRARPRRPKKTSTGGAS
ncbi:NYN domain-containing protein [Permianibacter aggregans]|uniref:OST-HTH/LOTUS domain-containing protein n=1 Tax=Permianibacter aggregans TaxID=1510150 RepID=A0A4R6UGP5_9GAMM|nr:NYN domain-containing protein [Permianibacter aggregans]QGX39204.1 NYN domain-containing protein [Permianibacter aggregans]TDQ46010.1 OST-HTH/LOTUS domain-containing protein [Permianibacter aggregans]